PISSPTVMLLFVVVMVCPFLVCTTGKNHGDGFFSRSVDFYTILRDATFADRCSNPNHRLV
ncbi:MAG TPA: hypothetical protein V6D47_12175, partial [Oscillatoriaceae cyanobacterium]